MRISPHTLFVSHSGETGGAELALLERLPHYRPPSAVALLADGPFKKRLDEAGVSTFLVQASPHFASVRRGDRSVTLGTLGATLRVAFRLARIARRHELVVANSQKAFVACTIASMLARRPLVWILHDILSIEHFSPRLISLVVRLANRFAVRVVTVSEAVKVAAIAAGIDRSRLSVAINGVEPSGFEKAGAVDQGLVGSLGDARQPLVGAFSRLAPWKGQHLLLDALPFLPGVHVLFVGGALFGEADYEAHLRRRAAVLDVAERVHFLGHRSDVASIMKIVDVVVHTPIAAEPFGRVVVEAMFAGKPLVTVREGGIGEIARDRETALIVPSGDARSIAVAVAELLANPRLASELGTAARAHAMEHFTATATAAAFEEQLTGACVA
jgi:glycosyltransferase involved in cell wall biosynthesis